MILLKLSAHVELCGEELWCHQLHTWIQQGERKGFFFLVNEDAHLCCSLHDSQDLIISHNKENNGFLGLGF